MSYQIAGQYLNHGSDVPLPNRTYHEEYIGGTQTRENFSAVRREGYTPQPPLDIENSELEELSQSSVDMNWKTKYISNTADPRVWGPAFWFGLHVSAAHYPLDASPIVRTHMKNRILALPHEVSCVACKPHAQAFIEKNRDNLDKIVSGRHELGKFYVDFHNQVNKRNNSKIWTYEEAYKMYSGGANIRYLQ